MRYSGGFTPETSDISEDASSDTTEAKLGELSIKKLRSTSESEDPRQTSPGNILQPGSRIMNMHINKGTT